MSSTNYAQTERAELCALFEQVGPDAPTRCEGWTTRDLAAHLVVRERRPDAALGILAAPFERHGEKVRLETADQPWEQLVELVRSGPPTLSLFGVPAIDRAANTMEYFIHHEDVRRAQPRWTPRELPAPFETELWKVISRMSKLMLRKAPAGVRLSVPVATSAATDASDASGRSVVAHKGEPQVEVIGAPGELALFVYGRQATSVVEMTGAPADVEAVRNASFGL